MQLCPRCKKSRPVEEVLETDKKTNKRWLVSRCRFCHYNYDLEEWRSAANRKT